MSFQPVIPFGGAAGWAFLQRTQPAQQEAFENSPVIQRETEYFQEKIQSITSAEDLVNDHRLLKVALGAFGLDDDLSNKFFIKKVLEEGTIEADALSNKLSDKRYFELSKAFGFGDYDIPRTQLSDFAAKLTDQYESRQFEIAVGEQNSDMRIALSLERELSTIVDKTSSDTTKWYSVMGNPPLRQVFETALGLPSSFGTLDLDQQMNVFRDKSERYFGDSTVDQFADQDRMDELNRLFLVRSQIATGSAGMSGGAIAVMLLQNSQR